MKFLVYIFFLIGGLTLTACSTINPESNINKDLTDIETEEVELAKSELSLDEFNDAIEVYNQEMGKVNDAEVRNLLKGATYDAYLLTRAKLSKENFEKAKAQDIFAKEITYEDYKSVADTFIDSDEFYETMVIDDEEGSYGAYAAKAIQYLTPEGNPN